jgi:hypothetical protein
VDESNVIAKLVLFDWKRPIWKPERVLSARERALWGKIKTVVKRTLSAAEFELRRITDRAFAGAIHYHSYSKSQLLQDVFVLAVLREKRNGFFVEFGAFDGITFGQHLHVGKEVRVDWHSGGAEPHLCSDGPSQPLLLCRRQPLRLVGDRRECSLHGNHGTPRIVARDAVCAVRPLGPQQGRRVPSRNGFARRPVGPKQRSGGD